MDLERLRQSAREALEKVSDSASLESWRITFLGRKSELAKFLRSLPAREERERRTLGKAANDLRRTLEDAYRDKRAALVRQKVFSRRALDITQPGKKFHRAHLHPLTIVLREMLKIFSSMGFEVVEGPEIETEYYNFDALNIPAWHPSRDMWDTLWLKEPERQKAKSKKQKLLLRTHTSPMQIRYMETHTPPFRIVVPGRVFRHEATDARHEMDFLQLEGLMVGEEVSFANLKAVMASFFKQFFGKRTELRLRASYFPFTEPSFEILMPCVICHGSGRLGRGRCPVCGGEGWLEMGGAGMVHPEVFRNVGYDPAKVQGFAFGMGPDRLAMIKYKISDIRLFRSGDLRFTKQF